MHKLIVTMHKLIVMHRMADGEARRFGWKRIGEGSKDSVAMVLAP